METYHACLTCGASLRGKYGFRGPRKFCDKSCAQSYRNRLRVVRIAPLPPAEPGVRFVPLTQSAFAKVDEGDFADLSRWNWYLFKSSGSLKYAVRGRTLEERADVGLTGSVSMHRYLMGEPQGEVDHCNGDGLDNRRENLRQATHAQNMMNAPSQTGSSRFKGVSWSRKYWRASIRDNYKTVHIGRFDTEEEAARAYDDAARRLHGAFSRVNFPREGERSALRD